RASCPEPSRDASVTDETRRCFRKMDIREKEDAVAVSETRTSPGAGSAQIEGRSAASAERPWYRRPLMLAATAVLLLAAIIGGTLWWLEARKWQSTDDAFIDAHIVRVASQVVGRVGGVLVDDNQEVKQGDKLIEIDPAP